MPTPARRLRAFRLPGVLLGSHRPGPAVRPDQYWPDMHSVLGSGSRTSFRNPGHNPAGGQIQAITHDRIQAPHRRIWSLPTNRASWPPQMPCFETLPVTFVHPHHSAPRHGAARGPTSQRAAARRRAQPHATATRTPRVQCAIHAAAAHHDRAARNTAQHVLHGPGATRCDSLKIQTRRLSVEQPTRREDTRTPCRGAQTRLRQHTLTPATTRWSARATCTRERVPPDRRGGWRPITDKDIARTRGCADSAETRQFAQTTHPG